MAFRQSEVYQELNKGDLQTLIPVLEKCLENGQLFITDPDNGDTLIHVAVRNAEKYSTPQTVTLIYLFGYAPFDLDTQNIDGDTALHLAVRKKGAYRILIALMRCGADPEVKNNDGKTPEDILRQDKPTGWKEMLHWLNKFKPGLYRAVTAKPPNKRLIEKLLRYWCRLTLVKDKTVINLKCIVHCKSEGQLDLVYLLEKYENTIEFAMALLSGKMCAIKSWTGGDSLDISDIWNSVDIHTKDYSYQVNTEYPEVQQPLLEAVWQTNALETTDHLMSLGPITSLLYRSGINQEPTPLFFHIVNERSPNRDIINRVLRDCDLSVRDYKGYTILHEAIVNNKSTDIIRDILDLGVNLAARDRNGQTARHLAMSLQKYQFVSIIDEYVLRSVKECNIPEVESLILSSYDYITNITDNGGLTAIDIAKKDGSKQLSELVEKIPKMQETLKKLHSSVAKGNMDTVKKILVKCKRYAMASDKGGRNILHHAIMHRRSDLIVFLLKDHPQTINSRDNLGRTPLHYMYLFLPDNNAVPITFLEKNGADKKATDYAGVLPSNYQDHYYIDKRRKEVAEFDLDVFISETNLEITFLDAIRAGDLRTVKKLTTGLKEYDGIKRYNKMLFECIDQHQFEIANYLIQNGFNTDISKQYEHCSPDNPLCAMMECNHGVTSFKQRLEQVQAGDLINLIDKKPAETRKCIGKCRKTRVTSPKLLCKRSSSREQLFRDTNTSLVSISSLQAR